jgi:hypothetical protein
MVQVFDFRLHFVLQRLRFAIAMGASFGLDCRPGGTDRDKLSRAVFWTRGPLPRETFHMTRSTTNDACVSCGKVGKLHAFSLCSACYQRQRRGSPAVGAVCCCCGEYDVRLLRSLTLATGERVAACFNCAHLGERARPRPKTVAELRLMRGAGGDRRQPGQDRRQQDRREPGWERRGPEGCRRLVRFEEGDRRLEERRQTR